jgi:hypothetical protein
MVDHETMVVNGGDYVTRAEFDMLRDQVARNVMRQDKLASDATAGIGSNAAISVQMTEVIKDVAEVRNELSQFREAHVRQHEREAAARTMSRRWAWGFAAVGVGSVWAPLLYLVTHIH